MKLLDFNKTFKDEESCEQYLRELREKDGVVCKTCGGKHQYWDKYNTCWVCARCHHRTTLTAGTLFHGSKLPLLYWFMTIHLLTSTKKTFSASEIQRQLGHKRYQPIWEMVHKIRSVMGLRDNTYQLSGSVELDEGYFTSENSDKSQSEKPLKRGVGSQRKSKVLVMVESEETVPTKKSQKSRKSGHIKMQIVPDLKADTITEKAIEMANNESALVMDASTSHTNFDKSFDEVDKKVVEPKDAPKILPWVHIAISNAKSLILDMYHGVKDEFLQAYLNEFCYKFNRRYFGDKLFDRLMVASVLYRPTFQHRTYRIANSSNCG